MRIISTSYYPPGFPDNTSYGDLDYSWKNLP